MMLGGFFLLGVATGVVLTLWVERLDARMGN